MNSILLAALLAATGFKGAHNFMLPDGAVKIDDDRYRLSQAWDEAVRFFRITYPPGKFPRHVLHSQSAVRAVHIENPSGIDWEGVNLYESGRGEVRVYVESGKESPEPEPEPEPAPRPDEKKKKK